MPDGSFSTRMVPFSDSNHHRIAVKTRMFYRSVSQYVRDALNMYWKEVVVVAVLSAHLPWCLWFFSKEYLLLSCGCFIFLRSFWISMNRILISFQYENTWLGDERCCCYCCEGLIRLIKRHIDRIGEEKGRGGCLKRCEKTFDLPTLYFNYYHLFFADDYLSVTFLSEPWQSWSNGIFEGLAHIPYEWTVGSWHVPWTWFPQFPITPPLWRYAKNPFKTNFGRAI